MRVISQQLQIVNGKAMNSGVSWRAGDVGDVRAKELLESLVQVLIDCAKYAVLRVVNNPEGR